MTNDPPLSVQLYSLRELEPRDRDGVLRRLAQIGFDAVEPYRPLDDPEGLRALTDAFGLAVPSLHARGLVDGDADAVFDAAEVLGAQLVIVPSGIPAEDFGDADGIARAADLLNGLAERAAARDLSVGYHNHGWEIEVRSGDGYALEALAAALEPAVVLQLDVYWAALAGADVLDLMRRLAPRVRALHLKDGPLVRGEPQTALGRGAMPLGDILAAAPRALRVVELDDCAGDVFDALAESRRYLAALT